MHYMNCMVGVRACLIVFLFFSVSIEAVAKRTPPDMAEFYVHFPANGFSFAVTHMDGEKVAKFFGPSIIPMLPGRHSLQLFATGELDRGRGKASATVEIDAKAGMTYTFVVKPKRHSELAPDSQVCVYEEPTDLPKYEKRTFLFRFTDANAERQSCFPIRLGLIGE